VKTTIQPTDELSQAREIVNSYQSNRRDFEDLRHHTEEKLRERLQQAEAAAACADALKDELNGILIGIIQGDPETIRGELMRRALLATGQPPPASNDADEIREILEAAGIADLQTGATMAAVEQAVRYLALYIETGDPIRRATLREAAIQKLDAIGIKAPGRLLDAAMPKPTRDEADGAGKSFS